MCASQPYGSMRYIRGMHQWLQESGLKKGQKGQKKQDLQGFFKFNWSSGRVQEQLQQLSPSASFSLASSLLLCLPSFLSHPWVWPTPLRTDRSVVSTRAHPPHHPLATHTWRRAGDCLPRTLAPSGGLGATHWAFPVSWTQFEISYQKSRFEVITAAQITLTYYSMRAILVGVLEKIFHWNVMLASIKVVTKHVCLTCKQRSKTPELRSKGHRWSN